MSRTHKAEGGDKRKTSSRFVSRWVLLGARKVMGGGCRLETDLTRKKEKEHHAGLGGAAVNTTLGGRPFWSARTIQKARVQPQGCPLSKDYTCHQRIKYLKGKAQGGGEEP